MPKLLMGDMCGSSNALSENARSCPACGSFTHRWEDVEKLTETAPKDICTTWDGVDIMSQKFKAALDEAGVVGVEYKQVARTRYAFRPVNYVQLDISGALYQAKGFCMSCGRFSTYLGDSTMVKILEGQRKIGPLEMVRGVPGFGSGEFRCDELIVGDELARIMKTKGLRGVQWLDFPAKVDVSEFKYPDKRVVGIPG